MPVFGRPEDGYSGPSKRMERTLVHAADAVVVLTHKARQLLLDWYPTALRNKPIEVIPCCVDLRTQHHASPAPSAQTSRRARRLVYIGKLGGLVFDGSDGGFRLHGLENGCHFALGRLDPKRPSAPTRTGAGREV